MATAVPSFMSMTSSPRPARRACSAWLATLTLAALMRSRELLDDELELLDDELEALPPPPPPPPLPPTLPVGQLLRLVFPAGLGDPHYLGLDAVAVYDAAGVRVPLRADRVFALPAGPQPGMRADQPKDAGMTTAAAANPTTVAPTFAAVPSSSCASLRSMRPF